MSKESRPGQERVLVLQILGKVQRSILLCVPFLARKVGSAGKSFTFRVTAFR